VDAKSDLSTKTGACLAESRRSSAFFDMMEVESRSVILTHDATVLAHNWQKKLAIQ
jgi:hypothetical protein